MKKITFAFLAILLAVIACSTSPVSAPPQVNQPGVETVVAATMQSLTPTAPALAGTAIKFGNVSLVNPLGLASNINGAQMPAIVGDQNGAPWDAGPAHIELTLDGYVTQGGFSMAKVYIYPAQEFAAANTGAAQNLIRLQTLLLNPNGNITNDTLPHVPFFNAAQIFAAQVKIVKFQNGSGVRMVTQYGQAPSPVINNSIFYHFEGLTSDGKYYIIAILPITAPTLAYGDASNLPVPPGGVPFPGYDSPDLVPYFNAVTTMLNSTAPEMFNPTINILDALIASIQVVN